MTLTHEERKILRCLSTAGLSDRGIAEETGIPLNEVKVAVRRLCRQLGFGGPESPRMQLALYGRRKGFGSIPKLGRVK